VTPAALTDGVAPATNHGLVYLPISQFDPNQYSDFKLPDFADRASEATVFTMIARAVAADRASDYLIDVFWDGSAGTWTAARATPPANVVFSDSANTVVAAGNAGFPIAAGSTDLAAMLRNGPVMIGDGAQPTHWLLATQMTPDREGIVANDTVTGKQIVLGYDAAARTIGAVTAVYDAKAKSFIPLADAISSSAADALNAQRLADLKDFGAVRYVAVAVK
jgi:hypothetical protein